MLIPTFECSDLFVLQSFKGNDRSSDKPQHECQVVSNQLWSSWGNAHPPGTCLFFTVLQMSPLQGRLSFLPEGLLATLTLFLRDHELTDTREHGLVIYIYLLAHSTVPVRLDTQYAFKKNSLSASMSPALYGRQGVQTGVECWPRPCGICQGNYHVWRTAFRKKPKITYSFSHFPLPLPMSFPPSPPAF